MLNRIVLNIDKDVNTYSGNKECQNTTDKLKMRLKNISII